MAKIPEGFTPPPGCEPFYLVEDTNHVATSLLGQGAEAPVQSSEEQLPAPFDTAQDIQGAEQSSILDLYLDETQMWALSSIQAASGGLAARVQMLAQEELDIQVPVQGAEGGWTETSLPASSPSASSACERIASEMVSCCGKFQQLSKSKQWFINDMVMMAEQGMFGKLQQLLQEAALLKSEHNKEIRKLLRWDCCGVANFGQLAHLKPEQMRKLLQRQRGEVLAAIVAALIALAERILALADKLAPSSAASQQNKK